MLAVEVVGGRAGRPGGHRRAALTELTASLGSVHTMVVHPPSTSQRQLSEAELIEAASRRAAARVASGSRTSRTSSPTSRAALAAARGAAAVPAGV